MRKQAGFTLAELVLVMVVIGILASVAVPRMFDMGQFSARGTRDFVGAALRYAQKSAIAMRRNVCVSVTATQLNVTYASTSGAGQSCAPTYPPATPGNPTPDPVNSVANPGNGLPYSNTSNALPQKAPVATSASVVFDAQGRPLSTTTYAPLTSTLTITVTGHATPLSIEPETGTVR
jgi:MSHA pilin protein MshC